MSKTPYVFALNVEQAKNNINKLEGAGISKKVIGQLVDHNPLVLAYSFREDSLETINRLTVKNPWLVQMSLTIAM